MSACDLQGGNSSRGLWDQIRHSDKVTSVAESSLRSAPALPPGGPWAERGEMRRKLTTRLFSQNGACSHDRGRFRPLTLVCDWRKHSQSPRSMKTVSKTSGLRP